MHVTITTLKMATMVAEPERAILTISKMFHSVSFVLFTMMKIRSVAKTTSWMYTKISLLYLDRRGKMVYIIPLHPVFDAINNLCVV
jgi:hypothetical protein